MNGFVIVLAVLNIIISLGLVILGIFQEGNAKGLGAISGGADTFFGKSKGRSMDRILKKLTTLAAGLFGAFTIILYLLTGRG